MEIQNKVKNTKVFSLQEFLALDFNSLKENDNRDVSKLKNSILKNGFVFPIYIWADHNYCIDGKGRELAIRELVDNGCTIKEIPYVEIEAKDLDEAKQRVLEASSQFGYITKDSFIEFTKDLVVDFDTFDIRGIDGDLFIESDEIDGEEKEEKKPRMQITFESYADLENARGQIEEILLQFEGAEIVNIGNANNG